MLKYKTITREVREIEDCLCNKCGESQLYASEDGFECKDIYGVVCDFTGGYFSKYLADCTRYQFSLCEKCLKELFDTFKIPVQIDE